MLTLYYDIIQNMNLLKAKKDGILRYPRFFLVRVNEETLGHDDLMIFRAGVPQILTYAAHTIFYVDNNEAVYLKNRWNTKIQREPLTDKHMMQVLSSVDLSSIA